MYFYGRNSFNAALDKQSVAKVYIRKDDPLIKSLKSKRIKYQLLSTKELDHLAGTNKNQGIVFEKKREYQLYELNDIINQKYELIVILDSLKDPHNLGAILRTCDAIGVDGIIYKKHHSVSLNDTVAKVSTGAIEYVKCVEVSNLNNTIDKLKKEGYWIVGLEADADRYYTEIDYKMKLAIVLGSEGEGISHLLSKNLDFKIKLPLNGHVNSLNVSNAAAICLYHIYENRKQ